jgi:hypothetical protein
MRSGLENGTRRRLEAGTFSWPGRRYYKNQKRHFLKLSTNAKLALQRKTR